MTFEILIGLVGGLGLFIYGMNVMSEGLKSVAGNRLKKILEILTNNRFMAVFVGTLVTVIVQSSSTTTVMMVGFVNAGLMNLYQAAGVILGANIGTTITAQLIAFKVTHFAPIFIAIGTVLALFSQKKKNRTIGEIILGFGILFLGIGMMSDIMKPLRDNPIFIEILVSFGKNPLLGLLAGLAITAIIQSSSATVGLLQAVALSGAFGAVDQGSVLAIIIPILLGMNIGTCVTAMLSSIGTNVSAKKAALIHLIVNIFGSIWVLIVLGIVNMITQGNNPIYEFINSISGQITINGVTTPDFARQIANTHTIFNIANMIVLFPFMGVIVKLIDRLITEKVDAEESALQLDERLLENPAVAIGQLVKEVQRMGNLSNKNLRYSIEAILNKDEKLCRKVITRERIINDLNRDLTRYLVLLSNTNLMEDEHEQIMSLYHCIHDIERIGDHAENLVEIAQYRIDNKVTFSNTAVDELKDMMNMVVDATSQAVDALASKDRTAAVKIIKIEEKIDSMEKELRNSHIERLNKGVCNPSSGVIYLDIISNLERIGDHATNIAQYILD